MSERRDRGEPSILAATKAGLYRVGGGPEGRELEGPVDSVASDRWGLWALVDGRSLWRRVHEGRKAWVEVTEVEGPPGRCLLATDDGLFVGTAEAGLLRLEDGLLQRVKGFDEAPGRDTWYTPWGGPPDTRSLSQGADGTLYANVHVGGILRSPDGERWEPTIDVDADVHQVLAHPSDPDVLLAAAAPGLAVSRDGGETWTFHREGLHGRYCRAVAVADEDILVSASTGPFTERAAVYHRRLDAEGPFERCTEGLPDWFPSNVDSHCLVAAGHIAALGTEQGEVFLSSDHGSTWEPAATGLPGVRWLLLAD